MSVVLSLWVALFCFTTVVALLFQKLILPSIPSMHAGFGLMNNDAIKFHQVAVDMAAKIQASGWSWAFLKSQIIVLSKQHSCTFEHRLVRHGYCVHQ